MITLPNSLDQDRARHDVGPDLDPSYLTLMVFLKDEKVDFEINQQVTKKHEILPSRQSPYGPRHKKTCLRRFANNKGADQPAHARSLISTFVIRFL